MSSNNQDTGRTSCRLAAVQMVSGANPDVNRERAAFLLDMAAANGAEMAVRPENLQFWMAGHKRKWQRWKAI